MVLLNAKQQLLKIAVISQGTLNETVAHLREIFKPVITHSAYSFVLVHNHPTGAMPYPVLCRTEHGVHSDKGVPRCGIEEGELLAYDRGRHTKRKIKSRKAPELAWHPFLPDPTIGED